MTKALPATQNSGMLLFDSGNIVGNWTGDPSTRGMYDKWNHKDGKHYLTVELNEDYIGKRHDHEFWLYNDKTGYCEPLGYGTYLQCLKQVNEYMSEKQFWESIV